MHDQTNITAARSPSTQSIEALDQLIAHHVAGNLPRPIAALVGAHLEINGGNACLARGLETAAGNELASVAPAELSSRDDMLARVFASVPANAGKSSPLQPCEVLPSNLVAYAGRSLRDIPWRNKLPGLKEFRLPGEPGFEAVLYWIRPGRAMPDHTHGGSEFTLVLQGGFSDQFGHYQRGDVAAADETVDHRPVADDDEPCICLAVTTAPLRMTGTFRQLFSDIFGR
jgi:putative transcriptional regulator